MRAVSHEFNKSSIGVARGTKMENETTEEQKEYIKLLAFKYGQNESDALDLYNTIKRCRK